MSPSATLVGSPSICSSTSSSSPQNRKVDGAPSSADGDVVLDAPPYEGEGTEASPYVVKFLPGDIKADPMQWSERKKWLVTANVAFSTLCVVSGKCCFHAELQVDTSLIKCFSPASPPFARR